MLHNIRFLYLHCVFHGIRFKVNNEDWLSVRMAISVFNIGTFIKYYKISQLIHTQSIAN